MSKLSNVNLITAANKVWSSGTNGWLLCSLWLLLKNTAGMDKTRIFQFVLVSSLVSHLAMISLNNVG